MKIIVGITGGSGGIYAVSLLKILKELNIETHLVVSAMGEYIIEHECRIEPEELKKYASYYYDNNNLTASIASGSFKTDGMIVMPCSMKSLSAIGHGYSDSLITRAADVIIKEGRKLVVVPRESPFYKYYFI